MATHQPCLDCEGTGIVENGFCHMCSGFGSHETLLVAVPSATFNNVNTSIQNDCMDLKQMILSITAHTTPEQLSSIMSHYMNSQRELDSSL